MAKAKTNNCTKECNKNDKNDKNDKPCKKTDTANTANTAKKVDVNEIKDKVTNVAGKIPQWISKAKKELEGLIEKLNKLDAYLAKILEIFGGQVTWDNVRRIRGTRSERKLVTLLMKQRQAMVAYKEALEARIAAGENGETLKVNP